MPSASLCWVACGVTLPRPLPHPAARTTRHSVPPSSSQPSPAPFTHTNTCQPAERVPPHAQVVQSCCRMLPGAVWLLHMCRTGDLPDRQAAVHHPSATHDAASRYLVCRLALRRGARGMLGCAFRRLRLAAMLVTPTALPCDPLQSSRELMSGASPGGCRGCDWHCCSC